MGINMKVIGKKEKLKGKEFFIAKMVINMKEILKIILEKVKQYIIIKMEIDMKVNGNMD